VGEHDEGLLSNCQDLFTRVEAAAHLCQHGTDGLDGADGIALGYTVQLTPLEWGGAGGQFENSHRNSMCV